MNFAERDQVPGNMGNMVNGFLGNQLRNGGVQKIWEYPQSSSIFQSKFQLKLHPFFGGSHGNGEIPQWIWGNESKLYETILVGGWATPLKNMNINWDDYSQYMGK